MNVRRSRSSARRTFLMRSTAMGAAALFGLDGKAAGAEAPPETTRVRIAHAPFICLAPQYLAEDLLALEGFTDLEYVPLGSRTGLDTLAQGKADICMWNTPRAGAALRH